MRHLGTKKQPSKQYEVIALEDLDEEDFIGEYVGKVIYQKVNASHVVQQCKWKPFLSSRIFIFPPPYNSSKLS